MQKKAPLPASVIRQQFRVAARKRKLDEIKELLPSDDGFVNGTVDLATSKMPRIEYELTPDKKIPFNVANSVNTEQLLDLLLLSKCLVKSIPTRSTFVNYLSQISILRKKLNASPGFQFVNNTDEIINAVNQKYNKLSSKSSIYRSFAAIAGRICELEIPYKIFSNLNFSLKNIELKNIEENTLSEIQKKSWLSWDKILELTPAIDAMSIGDQLLYAIYTEISPRRVEDYYLLAIYIETTPMLILDSSPSDGNYLIVDASNVPIAMSISIYKTSKTYGSYRFFLEKNSKLFNLFQSYISHGPAHGDFLFSTRDLQSIGETSFSKKIGDLFEKATLQIFGNKLRITANILRHSFISNIFEKNLYKTVAQRKKLALEMGHSLKAQFCYLKYVE